MIDHSFNIQGPGNPVYASNGAPLFLIAGPCVIESRRQTLETAEALRNICGDLGIPLVFKSSFDKANRGSAKNFRGRGMDEGLSILGEIRETLKLPVLTDIHAPEQAASAAAVVDVLQIPAFLCRQTDLVVAAASTGRPCNIKKGQFVSPWEMEGILTKTAGTGNKKIMLCERGSSFGYNNLVVDMRGLEIMKRTGYPVIFDATHAVQLPGAAGGSSGGQREFVPALSRAAAAVGIAGLFMETHPDPDAALCDGPNMLALRDLPLLLKQIKAIDALVKSETEKKA
jgi:2-dehydro-3-deoxyphosphooctonate aldolase (KDO 8-P synthase)